MVAILIDTWKSGMTVQEKKTLFEAYFEKFLNTVLQFIPGKETIPKEVLDSIETSMRYNIPGGKLNRGLAVIDTLEILQGESFNEQSFEHAAILGWCIEMLQALLLIADDIMDASQTRRGQICWYKVPEIGSKAINHALFMQVAISKTIKQFFGHLPCYVSLFEIFEDVAFKTIIGQECDLNVAPETNVDLTKFSLAKHNFIVKYKTAYYSFYLPVAVAMIYNQIRDENAFKAAEDILVDIGVYFQVQDDFLDCYGDPEVIGKIGTDIVDNKCSWLINVAINECNKNQEYANYLDILKENYGRKSSECENKVKFVYKQLNLEKLYYEYEETTVEQVRNKIDQVTSCTGLDSRIFSTFLNKIYKRNK